MVVVVVVVLQIAGGEAPGRHNPSSSAAGVWLARAASFTCPYHVLQTTGGAHYKASQILTPL